MYQEMPSIANLYRVDITFTFGMTLASIMKSRFTGLVGLVPLRARFIAYITKANYAI